MKLIEFQEIKNKAKLLQEAEQFLIEHLGNLDFINKELLKPLLAQRSAPGRADKIKRTMGFGKDSKVTVKSAKNGTQAWEMFMGEDRADKIKDPLPIAMVFYVGAKIEDKSNQFFTIARQGGNTSSTEFAITCRGGLLSGDAKDKAGKALGTSFFPIEETVVKEYNYVSEAKVRIVITNFMKAAKEKNLQFNFALIYTDEVAKAKVATRNASKRGMVYTPKEIKELEEKLGKKQADNFTKNYRVDLKSRLTAYKEGKLSELKSTEDVLKFIKSAGYAEKIKIGPWIYKYDREEIRLDQLRSGKKDSWYSDSYVQYQLSNDDEYYAEQKKYRELLNKTAEEFLAAVTKPEDTAEQADEKKEKCWANALADKEVQKLFVPRFIKIIFKLNKDSIIPDRIEVK
jgi:hypothetical protein